MKRTQIKIKVTVPRTTQIADWPVVAYTDPAFPGLAVHHGHSEYKRRLWMVTHIASGRRITPYGFPKRRQAAAYARAAAEGIDWTQGEYAIRLLRATTSMYHALVNAEAAARAAA